MKICRLCGESKALEDFYRANGTRDGHRGECKSCFRGSAAARNRRNPEPNRDRARAWQLANPDRVRATQAKAVADGRKKASDRRSYLKRTYGLTVEQYEEMLAAQGGVCAICGREPREDISLHVDHDHDTGALRGILCFRCNNAIGDLAESWEQAERLASYLFEHDPEMVRSAGFVRRRVEALRIGSGA